MQSSTSKFLLLRICLLERTMSHSFGAISHHSVFAVVLPLQLVHSHAPEHVPAIYLYDEENSVMVMQFLPAPHMKVIALNVNS